jgi:hypothetical protein
MATTSGYAANLCTDVPTDRNFIGCRPGTVGTPARRRGPFGLVETQRMPLRRAWWAAYPRPTSVAQQGGRGLATVRASETELRAFASTPVDRLPVSGRAGTPARDFPVPRRGGRPKTPSRSRRPSRFVPSLPGTASRHRTRRRDWCFGLRVGTWLSPAPLAPADESRPAARHILAAVSQLASQGRWSSQARRWRNASIIAASKPRPPTST